MNVRFFPLMAGVALAATTSASALSISILQDDLVRFSFDVVWEAAPVGTSSLDVGNVSVQDDLTSLTVVGWPDFFAVGNTFDVLFSGGGRQLGDATVQNFWGVQVLGLPGESYGARFVYGEAYPCDCHPTAVPDGGHGGWMVALGLGALGMMRRSWGRS
jgi:MYXO-CTERM domain-containing protein